MKKKFLILSFLLISISILLCGCNEEKKPIIITSDISINTDLSEGLSPFTINFTLTTNNIDQKTVLFNWDFDDETISDEKNPEHTFYFEDSNISHKTYDVKLTLTDDAGDEYTDTIQITVYSNKRRITPIVDTHIDYIDQYLNFDTYNYLELTNNQEHISWPFLLFDLSNLNLSSNLVISQITLWLYSSNKSEEIFDISCSYSTGNDTFYDGLTEGILTYNSFFKANVTGYDFDTEKINKNGWYHWNLTDPQEVLTSKDRLIMVILQDGLEEGDYVWFNSKENPQNHPYIDVLISSN